MNLPGAKTDTNKLAGIQILLQEKEKKFNWKFTYAALEVLADLSLNGETQKIRENGVSRDKVIMTRISGLTTFAETKNLSKYIDLSPMVHFKRP